jgi:adenylylsulfate kinase
MSQKGFTVWFTGLPCSGKSTLAWMLQKQLQEINLPVEVLDGDEIRQILTKGLGYSKEDRDENIRRIAFVAKLLTRVGGVAIASAISPYRETRDWARAQIGNFVEVYVNCPLEVCIQRDVKGHYAKAIRGEMPHYTGISDPYEPPLHPEIELHTDQESLAESVGKLLDGLASRNLIAAARKQQAGPTDWKL